jgi:hypothetical protein
VRTEQENRARQEERATVTQAGSPAGTRWAGSVWTAQENCSRQAGRATQPRTQIEAGGQAGRAMNVDKGRQFEAGRAKQAGIASQAA